MNADCVVVDANIAYISRFIWTGGYGPVTKN